jgi:superfamily II DNA/RNA helicase
MFTIFDEGDKILGNLSSDDKLKKILVILPVNSKWYVFSATYTKKMIQDISKIKKCVYLHTLLKVN